MHMHHQVLISSTEYQAYKVQALKFHKILHHDNFKNWVPLQCILLPDF